MIAFNNSGGCPIFRGAYSLSLHVDSALRCGTVNDYNEAMQVVHIICVRTLPELITARERATHLPLAPLPFFENTSSVSTGSARQRIQMVL